MVHRPRLFALLGVGIIALSSCREDVPTQPESVDQSDLAPEFAVVANSWTKKAELPTGRFDLAVAVPWSAPGVLYAIGGMSEGDSRSRHSLTTVEAYSMATNTWTTRASLPAPLQQTNGIGAIGGHLYISGGSNVILPDFVEYSKALYAYNLKENTWTRKADLPRAITNGVTGVIGDKLYVLVGECRSPECAQLNTSRLYRYDPATDTWDLTLRACPAPHSNGAGGVINGKFYVVGGGGRADPATNRLHVYDPATNTWTEKAPLPISAYGMAAVVQGAKLYVMGGIASPSATWTNAVYAYNPTTNNWITKAPMPTGRAELAAARVLVDGRATILAVGGRGEFTATKANEAYTP
jgi:N-acetylneuraminic acid mutarotase